MVSARRDTDLVQPIKQLSNGHFLLVFAPTSTVPSDGKPLPAGTVDLVREIDLTGATIREISIDTLNSRLAQASANFPGSLNRSGRVRLGYS